METQTRSRPELRPVWTGRDQHPAYPRTTPDSATSPPLFSASLALPSPMYPASPAYDHTMRAHERALVDRLDRRGSQQSPATARSLSPISEQALAARRASAVSLPLLRAPVPPPRSPNLTPHPGSQTLAAQTRSILLSGVPDGLPRVSLETSPIADRRPSLPPWSAGGRRGSQQLRDDLRDWGHVYFGNVPISDCFVSAVALRRASDPSTDEGTPSRGRLLGGRNRITIRARVRPCALDRKPFLLRRTFDMDELRATIPEMSPVSAGPRNSPNERASRSPLPASRRRSSGTASAKHGPDHDRSHVQSTNTVPIRKPAHRQVPIFVIASANKCPLDLRYARAFFPVLAALLYSGHVKKGDIIDLPLPCPEAWTQTVTHAYTGRGELTDAVKQNILYLGGKV